MEPDEEDGGQWKEGRARSWMPACLITTLDILLTLNILYIAPPHLGQVILMPGVGP